MLYLTNKKVTRDNGDGALLKWKGLFIYAFDSGEIQKCWEISTGDSTDYVGIGRVS